MASPLQLQDGFRRDIRYLRISLTPHCNFRCSYCQPNGPEFEQNGTPLLSPNEVERIAAVFARLGVRKIRLTGGEPTLRPDLPEIVGRLAAIPGIDDLSLSTHGLFLEQVAKSLADAGLGRVNISLDSLRPDRFTRLAGREGLDRVLAGIRAAREFGLSPLKLNMVPLRGINDGEIGDFLEFAAEMGAVLRFIELMPLGVAEELFAERHLDGDELMRLLAPHGEWIPEERNGSSGPARCFRRAADGLEIGLINPLATNFCEGCNRVRITATGELRNCLFGAGNVPLRPALAGQEWERGLEALLRETIALKPERHNLNEHDDGELYSLSRVGG
jgi:cyclic pyranopterin phosphate synthase